MKMAITCGLVQQENAETAEIQNLFLTKTCRKKIPTFERDIVCPNIQHTLIIMCDKCLAIPDYGPIFHLDYSEVHIDDLSTHLQN